MVQHRAVISVDGLGRTPMNFVYDALSEDENFFAFILPAGTKRLIAKSRIRYADFVEVEK